MGDEYPRTLFGFARHEWELAHESHPGGAGDALRFFDSVTGVPDRGGLAGIGTESMLALASVSPQFARRLGAQLDSIDPDWREKLSDMLASPPRHAPAFGPEDAKRWRLILSLIDAADSPPRE